MIDQRFPAPPLELTGQTALYDYLYSLSERLNLLLEDLPGLGETAPAAGEAPLSARQTRALVQRSVAGLTAADIHGGALSCDSLSLPADTALTLNGETLAAYVQRQMTPSQQEEPT